MSKPDKWRIVEMLDSIVDESAMRTIRHYYFRGLTFGLLIGFAGGWGLAFVLVAIFG